MKRFRFPLRPVAVLRAHRESRAREVFAAAVHGYVQAMATLETTRQRIAGFEAALFHHRQGTFNAMEETHTFNGYRREVQQERADERAMMASREQMENRRNEYLEAHRQLETMNRLETKARTNHRLASQREEQAEFDEYASRRIRRGETVLTA